MNLNNDAFNFLKDAKTLKALQKDFSKVVKKAKEHLTEEERALLPDFSVIDKAIASREPEKIMGIYKKAQANLSRFRNSVDEDLNNGD